MFPYFEIKLDGLTANLRANLENQIQNYGPVFFDALHS